MTDIKQTQLFMSLFRGRTDVYARYWEKNGKSAYSPAYEFNWSEFMIHKARGGNLSNFPNKKTLLLTMNYPAASCGELTPKKRLENTAEHSGLEPFNRYSHCIILSLNETNKTL